MIAKMFATTFYSGYSRFAPGTVGAALALVPLYLIPQFRDIPLLTACFLIFFPGVWAATQVEKTEGHDPGMINIDEVVGMWVSVLFLPMPLTWAWLAGAFVVFRIFDIIKPWPANQSQGFSGGWGVMADDIFAGIYTNMILRLAFFLQSVV